MAWLKKLFCRHVFRGCDMGHRDESGKLEWACHKCGKVYRFDYGLQAGSVGTITGPWGSAPAGPGMGDCRVIGTKIRTRDDGVVGFGSPGPELTLSDLARDPEFMKTADDMLKVFGSQRRRRGADGSIGPAPPTKENK